MLAALAAAGLTVSPDVGAAPQRAPVPLRVVIPKSAASSAGDASLSPALESVLDAARIEVRVLPPEDWSGLSPSDTDAILLPGDRSTESFGSAATVTALGGAIERGVALVVAGSAAGAWAESEEFSALIGRSPAAVGPPAASGRLAVAILDQRHAVTQCLPHLVLDGATAHAAGSPKAVRDSQTLAWAARAEVAGDPASRSPVIWVSRAGGPRGPRVGVLALEATASSESGASSARTRRVLAALTARLLEFVCGRRTTVLLPGDLPVAAAHLGAADTGIVPGVPPLAKGFYRGREIAAFMTWHGAGWLVRPEREREERPDEVVRRLELLPGDVAVDLGAGVGYFSERLAAAVGPRGRVLAVDIQPEMLERLAARMARAGVTNVEPVLATATDPKLPDGAVDLALMVDVYHELSDPARVVTAVRRSLRPASSGRRAGRLVLVEYRGEDPRVAIKALHRMTEIQARAELEPMGFRWLKTLEFLPSQHVIVFERAPAATAEATPTAER